MGRHKQRRQAFFREHPLCCFCGGAAVATEEDHIPARHLFQGREWPEGYVFPACAACNDSSSLDELALGWLFRIRLGNYTTAEEAEAVQALEKLHRRRPEWIAELREFGRVESRRKLRELGSSFAEFGKKDLGLVHLPPALVGALERYTEKLGRALYYHHTRRIVPVSGHVVSRAFTNAEFSSPNFPWHKLAILSGIPAISRGGKSLDSQFTYRYAVVDGGEAAAFIIQFGESAVMLVTLFADADAYRTRREVSEAAARVLPSEP